MTGLLERLIAAAALVLAAIAFLTAVVPGFSAPKWVEAAAVLLLAVLVTLGVFYTRRPGERA